MEEVIRATNLTKNFRNKKGIFDVNFSVNRGEVFGIFGIKGSGKSTVFENIMGYLKPDEGSCIIHGLDSFKDKQAIKESVCYIPECIKLCHKSAGIPYILSQADKKDKCDIILMDSPFRGLDAYGKVILKDMINKLKIKEKAVVLSSEDYKELEGLCDRILLLHKGKHINTVNKIPFDAVLERQYMIGFHRKEEYELFLSSAQYEIVNKNNQYKHVILKVGNSHTNSLFHELEQFDVREIKFIPCPFKWYYAERSDAMLG